MKQLIPAIALSFIVIVIGNVVIMGQERKDMQISASDQKAVVEKLAVDLEENYVFPEVAKQISSRIKSNLSGYSSNSSSIAFADALTKDIQSVNNDRHLSVRFSFEKIPPRKERREPSEKEQREQAAFMKRINFGFDSVKRLEGNVGYIELRGFMDASAGEETVAATMNFIANTDSLIIDLRRNGGGSPEMVALICSYFFGEEKVHLNDLYWRQGNQTREFWTNPVVKGTKYLDKDIYILTSKRTFSAAEEFSYNLRNLNRAMIVGETTGGGAHPGGSFILGDHFSAFIATGRAISPITKTNWEGTGVKPHIDVDSELALATAHRKALEKSLNTTEDEQMKASLGRLIKKIDKKVAGFGKKKVS